MSSRRVEERNEKIIRGLLKLPPNRRCMNCSSLGPQYVCTDFWTFVCTTCSGLHREFTHRVKSVSMAKFTSQEVDALQNGGNQRARELLLNVWDPQRRLPDISNVEKVRQFIKNVYIEKLYSLEKSPDTASRDLQSIRCPEDQTRRASSYHSYSQSPPYDFQYEERRYGKHAFALTKKPGSDQGPYAGKLASFLSPPHLSGRLNDDIFPSDGSLCRGSDFSVSGVSPSSETSGDISGNVLQLPQGLQNVERSSRRSDGRVFHPQRASSCGGFTSFDSGSMSFKSVNSLGLSESGSAQEQPAELPLERSSSTFPQNSSVLGSFNGSDSNSTPFGPSDFPLINFGDVEVDLPKRPLPGSIPLAQRHHDSTTENHTSQGQQHSSLSLFSIVPHQQSAASSSVGTSSTTVPSSHGWAIFDLPESMMPMEKEYSALSEVLSSDGNVKENTNPFAIDQRSPYHDFMGHDHSALVFLEKDAGDSFKTNNTTDFKNDGSIRSPEASELHSSNLFMEINFPVVPSSTGADSLTSTQRLANPFDLPDESLVENSSNLWDMSSLEAAVPNAQMPTPFIGAADQLWFLEGSAPSFGPANGSLGIVAGQEPTSQIPPSIQPLASVGGNGNPFA